MSPLQYIRAHLQEAKEVGCAILLIIAGCIVCMGVFIASEMIIPGAGW